MFKTEEDLEELWTSSLHVELTGVKFDPFPLALPTGEGGGGFPLALRHSPRFTTNQVNWKNNLDKLKDQGSGKAVLVNAHLP